MSQKKQPIYAVIEAQYFIDYPDLVEVINKDTRLYLGLVIELNHNQCFIPLRTAIPTEDKFKKAVFQCPSSTRPNAGLDYRKLLIINDSKYINFQTKVTIPQVQKEKIKDQYHVIEKAVNSYVGKYVKEVQRGRAKDNYLYRFSTLQNYHSELSLDVENKQLRKGKVNVSSNIKAKKKGPHIER